MIIAMTVFEAGMPHWFPGTFAAGFFGAFALIYGTQLNASVSKVFRVIMVVINGLLCLGGVVLCCPGLFDAFGVTGKPWLLKVIAYFLIGVILFILGVTLGSLIIYNLHGAKIANNKLIKEIARYVKDNNASAVAVCFDGIIVRKEGVLAVPTGSKDSFTSVKHFESALWKGPAPYMNAILEENGCKVWDFAELNYPTLWNVEIDYAAKGITKRNHGYKSKKFVMHDCEAIKGDPGFTTSPTVYMVDINTGIAAGMNGGTVGKTSSTLKLKTTDNFFLILRPDLAETHPLMAKKSKEKPQKEKMNKW